MSLWQSVLLVTLYKADALWAVHALQRLETLGRDLAGTSDELNDLRQMLLIVCLEDLPEPADDVVRNSVAGILDIVLEIVDYVMRKCYDRCSEDRK